MDGKKLLIAWMFTSLALLAPVTALKAYAADKDLLIKQLYESANLERQLKWVHDSMTLKQHHYPLPNAVVDTVNQVVKVRYSSDYFRSTMKATLDEALSVSELHRLIDWYNSSLGQKVLRLEAMANNPDNFAGMNKYIQERLSQHAPRTNRIRLLEELMDVLDAVELSTDLSASASVGARRLLIEVMPAARSHHMHPSYVQKDREKLKIRKNVSELMRSIFLYTYRSLPDNDISSYLAFARESAMQNFQRSQTQALARIL